ncbi:SANT/Myb_domain [Hexamita inflata]|uniref:SANT/Myb_domain n=1 Tax=Hexamita inflata TaxID=28002 RepID=A0ABP1HER1_9EUKA
MQVTRPYNQWNEQETQKIIQLTRQYKENIINWRNIAANMNGRTPQQCKSYFNSKIRYIELRLETPVTLAKMAIMNLLNDRSQKQFCAVKRIYYDQILMEIIMNAKMIMQNNSTFQYNVRILQTIKNVIILFKQQKWDWIDQIKTQGFATYQQIIIQPNEFQHLQILLDNAHTSELYSQIIQLLKLKRYVNYLI